MQLPRILRRSAEIGVALTAVATLILAGCGGGGGSSSSSSGGGATTSTTVTPYKGMFTNGTVTLIDANGNPVTLSAGGSINASGVASVTFPASVAYPLTVQVTGTYLDETNGNTPVTITTPLRGLIPNAGQAASGVPVTVITDIARAMLPASGISAASAVAALTGAASSVLGVSYNQAMLPPVFDANGKTTDPTTIQLAALAQVIKQQGAGGELTLELHNLAAQLAAGSAVNAVFPQAVFASAVAAMNSASGVLPASATPPTITLPTLPGTPLTSAIQNSIPTCAQGQVLQIGAGGLSCVAGGGGGNQAACQASGGMWDPFIGVCLNGGNTGGVAVPAVPVGLAATAVSSSQIDLSWTAAANATGYNVYRAGAQFFPTSLANKLNATPIAGTTYSDTGLTAGTTYFYKVVAVNTPAALQSMASSEVSATTSAAGGGVGGTAVTNLTVPGGTMTITGTAIPSKSITSAATISYTPLMNQPGNIITISDGGVTATLYDYVSTSQIGFSISQSGFSIGLSTNNGCATSQAGVTPFNPLCSSVGVTYDRAAGTITFANSPMHAIVGTCDANCVVNGTLAFAPQ